MRLSWTLTIFALNSASVLGNSRGVLLVRTVQWGIGAFGGVVGEISMDETGSMQVSLEEAVTQMKFSQTSVVETIKNSQLPSTTTFGSTTGAEGTSTQYVTILVTVVRTLPIEGPVPT